MNKLLLGLLCLTVLSAPLGAAPKKPTPLSTEQRVQLLERKLKAMSRLVMQLDALQREVQQLRGEVEVQNHAMDALKKRQRDLYLDVDQRLNQLSHGSAAPAPAPVTDTTPPADAVMTTDSTPAAAPIAPAAPSTAVSPSPAPVVARPAPVTAVDSSPIDPVAEEKAYKAAFEMLMQRRYEDARGAFTQFLGQYPNGGYADNAQYWLAEASYVTRNFDAALIEFQAVIQNHPTSTKVPDALLKSSFIYYEKKQWVEARQTLEMLIKQHPDSTASRLATQRLQRMQRENH